jgi:outer membrane protein assembly factor BamB
MRVRVVASLAVILAVAGCTGGPPSQPSPTAQRAAATQNQAPVRAGGPPLTSRDWPAYHRDAARTGTAPAKPAAGKLSIAWRRRLDGAVYGQPLAVGNLVIAATEGDTVYGLDRASGALRWRAHLGTPVPLSSLPCGNIDPLGITGTTVYEPSTGLVYAVAETTGFQHLLAGISVTTGAVRFMRNIPTPDGQPRADQQRAALTVSKGRVYVAFGGLFGDCGPYRGSVVGVPVEGRGKLVSYRVPTAREAGIWEPGGPVTGPSGTVYVSVGNGAATKPPSDGSDSVTALSPTLKRTGIFAPTTWAADNAADLDLGSSSPALLPSGKILISGKRGTGYLLNASHLGGVGGQLAKATVCPSFGGASVRGTIAYLPCIQGGMAAVDTADTKIKVLWRGPGSAQGSPVLGGGAVWVPDWNGGVLYQLSLANGHVEHQIKLGSELPHFASPSLSANLVLLGTMSGVVAVRSA